MAKNAAQHYQTAREVAAAATATLDEASEVRTESIVPVADSAEPAPPTVC